MNHKPRSAFAILAFLLAALAGLATLGAGFGVKFGLWDFRTGFAILRWGAWGGLGAAAMAVIGAVLSRPGGRSRGFVLSLVALVVGLTSFAIPYQMQREARAAPKIHDITTDTGNPPPFRALLALRKGARNPPDYAGAAIATEQTKAYPDIQPLNVARGPAEAYQAALVAAAKLGWTIVAKAPAEGRIEATDRTTWFGFTDDIVVRVSATDQPGLSRIDVRSKSRVGRSDGGANARRVRAYLDTVKSALPPQG